MLGLQPVAQFAGFGPLILRVMAGIIMGIHGWQKLTEFGPANFGRLLADLGIPLGVFMGYVVTFAELIGGIFLIVGLLSRLAALMLAIEMIVTTLLVKTHVGFIAPPGSGAGAELDLILLAAFLTILLVGPGRLAIDELLGIEGETMGRARGRNCN
ncbi:MAG: DoxX family protein [Rubrobacter sp.]|nr:DoxX family protein [Rubrobacter sp.]